MHVRFSTVLLPLLAVVGASLPARDDAPYPLSKPVATKPAPDDERRAELARALCEALDRGDAEAATKALADGANANVGMGAGEETTKGRTPLIHAVLAGKSELVDLLLAHGARLENGDDAKHTPLMYAALTKNLELARRLVRAGARLDTEDEQGQTSLAYAPEGEELAQFLADAATKNAELLEHVSAGRLQEARDLLASGASPNANDGKTSLLMAAVRAGDVAFVTARMKDGCNPDLLHSAGFVTETPLSVAAREGNLDVLRALLKDRVPGRAALDHALACAANTERDDRAERVKLLLAAGADPSAQMLLQTPALPGAAARGDLATLALLLAAGADQQAVDHALVDAAGIEDGAKALAVVRALLAIGANPSFDYLYTTALGSAAERGHAAVLEALLPKCSDEVLDSAVAEAARAGNTRGLAWLCEHGRERIDFTYRAGPYESALVAAIQKPSVECVKVLLANGADANQPATSDEDSPLIAAVLAKDEELVALLLDEGADPEATWQTLLRGDQSALAVAKEEGADELVALFERTVASYPKDPIGRTLARSKLNYQEIGAFYELQYTNSETRRGQKVYVRKKGEEYGSLRVNELFSLCYDAAEAPTAEQLVQWFKRSLALGGFVLEAPNGTQDRWRVRLRMSIARDASPRDLRAYLQVLQSTADRFEQEFQPAAEDRL